MPPNNQVELEFLIKEQISKAFANIEKNLKKAQQETKTSGKSFLDFGNIVSTAIGFNAATAISSFAEAFRTFVIEGAQQAILMEQQLIALEFQTNKTADSLLDNLNTALDETVSRLDLARTANRALALGLKQDDLPALYESAAARAKIMGISTTQAINDIVTGIGRGSPLILDNLGIVFDAEKVYSEYAATLNKSADALTKQERAAALTRATIESTRVAVIALNSANVTLNTELEKAKTRWDNLKLSIGNAVAEGFGKLLLATEDLNVVLLEENEEYRKLNEKIVTIASSYEQLQKTQQNLINTQKELRNELESFGAVRTQEEIEAERELNRLKLQRIQTEKELSGVKKTEIIQLTDGGLAEIQSLEYSRQSKALEDINLKIQQQNFILEENAAKRRVITDEAIKSGEQTGLLKEEGTTIEDLKKQLQERLEAQKESNALLDTFVNTTLKQYASDIDNIKVKTEAIEQSIARTVQHYGTLERRANAVNRAIFGPIYSVG